MRLRFLISLILCLCVWGFGNDYAKAIESRESLIAKLNGTPHQLIADTRDS